MEPINRQRDLCHACSQKDNEEVCFSCEGRFLEEPHFEFSPFEPQGIYFDPSRNLDWMRMGLDQYLDDLDLVTTPKEFEIGLNVWLTTQHLTHVYEYELNPRKDAQKNLMAMAKWATQRYTDYQKIVKEMAQQLFSMQ